MLNKFLVLVNACLLGLFGHVQAHAEPQATVFFAALQSGEFNGVSFNALIYDKEGKRLDPVNGGFAVFFVADYVSRKKVDGDVMTIMRDLFLAKDNEDRSKRPVGIQRRAKEMLIITQDGHEDAFAINYTLEDYVVYPVLKVSESIFQFDYSRPTGRTLSNENARSLLKGEVELRKLAQDKN